MFKEIENQKYYAVHEEYLGENNNKSYDEKHFDSIIKAAEYANKQYKNHIGSENQYEAVISFNSPNAEMIYIAELSFETEAKCFHALEHISKFPNREYSRYIDDTHGRLDYYGVTVHNILQFDPNNNSYNISFKHEEGDNIYSYSFHTSSDFSNITYNKDDLVWCYKNYWNNFYDSTQNHLIEQHIGVLDADEFIALLLEKLESDPEEFACDSHGEFVLDTHNDYTIDNFEGFEEM